MNGNSPSKNSCVVGNLFGSRGAVLVCVSGIFYEARPVLTSLPPKHHTEPIEDCGAVKYEYEAESKSRKCDDRTLCGIGGFEERFRIECEKVTLGRELLVCGEKKMNGQ